MTTPTKASTSLPPLYRLTLLLLEPIFALGGALMVFTDPARFAAGMTRGRAPAAVAACASAGGRFAYTHLGGAWALFAFNEAVVMGLVDDLRVWRLLCAGMLLSDAAWLAGAAQAVGGWRAFVRTADWALLDWVAFLSAVGPLAVRLLILAGVGVRTGAPAREEKRAKAGTE